MSGFSMAERVRHELEEDARDHQRVLATKRPLPARLAHVALGLALLAGLADALTFALVPPVIRVYDFSPVARFLASDPLVLILPKLATVALMAGLVLAARWCRASRSLSLLFLGGAEGLALFAAILWTYGAWTNIAVSVR